MHPVQLSPSMMCADIFQMQSILDTFAHHEIELLHIDIMDGHFVPNMAMGTDYVRMLREHTHIPFDFHLMVNDPMAVLPWYDIKAGDYVSIHVENTIHLQRVLAWIKAKGAKPMVVLNPATPIFVLEEVLTDIEGVLLMTVNPGFAGQKVVPQTIEKITRLRQWLDQTGYTHIKIEVDGNVSFETSPAMRRAGADIFVCGTSSVFSKNDTLDNNITTFRNHLEKA